MLVTMATNELGDYPGFRAQVSQMAKGSARGMNEDTSLIVLCIHHYHMLNTDHGRKYFKLVL